MKTSKILFDLNWTTVNNMVCTAIQEDRSLIQLGTFMDEVKEMRKRFCETSEPFPGESLNTGPKESKPNHPANWPTTDAIHTETHGGIPQGGLVFEVGGYYEHSGGGKLSILGVFDTTMYGKNALLAEDTEGNFRAVGRDSVSVQNWIKITHEQWMSSFS